MASKLQNLTAATTFDINDLVYLKKSPLTTPLDRKSTFGNLKIAINDNFDVKAYGAVGDGITDDYTAINNAVVAANAAGGGTVFFPIGTYLINTAIVLLSNVKFEGAGFHLSILKVNGSNDMFHYTANISHLEWYNMSLTATGGHVFYNTTSTGKIGYSKMHHVFVTQNSSTKCWWYQTDGNLISMLFEECYFYAAGATRTYPAWYNIDPHGGANSNWWNNNTFEMESSANQPVFYVECQTTNDYTYDNHWFNNVFEVANGGCIKLMSTFGSTIDGCYAYDATGQVLPNFYLGKSSLGIRSTNSTIRNSGRIGSNIGVGVQDIQFDSHTRQVVIDSCRTANDTLRIDCGNATQITYINIFIPGGTTIINPGSGGFLSAELHDNGGLGYDVKAFGANGDGVTDDSAAIQACIDYVAALDSPGGTVIIPIGIYILGTALTLKTRIRFQGQGYTTQLKVTGTNNMFTWSTSVAFVEFCNMRLLASGASSGDLFSSSSAMSQARFDRVWFSQTNTAKGVWNQVASGISNSTFKKCDFYVSGASRSIPAFYFKDAGSTAHDNLFEDCVCTYADTCANQPFFYIECTNGANGYTHAWHWNKVQFETCDGGAIKLLSAFGCTMNDCWTVDNSSMELPFILIDKSGTSGALPSSANHIRNCGRRDGAADTGVADIKLGSSTRQTIIENFRCSSDNGIIDVNSSTDCYILYCSAGTTINNVSGTTTIIRNGAIMGIGVAPTARLHLPAGTATANTAPLKLVAGTNLTTPEDGAIEFNGTHLYITISGVRTQIV